ncbi:hypothetical protein GRAN_0312 [Granulicella sibirica]|uniref:Organic solvent tolerance-like N-terminal domain-containing protein n=1 Tax=Granulicella sibirica TaxID=2479048 RepID=A0A4Q0T2D8_9BACT|nr:hypothetical protein GRAN_0312 [Granulicella sibirica]
MVGATLLVLVVGGFLGYAHYRSRRFLAGLPGRLGANISRQAEGYTWSQSGSDGHAIFTMHAAKLEQRNDGKVLLHDVGIVLYGRKQDRADRVYGNEFEYDQAAEIIRAIGEVHMDLEAPAPADGSTKKQRPVPVTEGEPVSDAKMIHVKTSGLVYLKKLGVAATPEDIEFSEGKMTGRAHGADYNSDTGVLVLQSNVRMNGLTTTGPMVMTASRAELHRLEQVADLTGAKVVTTQETVTAEQGVVHVRKDGSPERMEGSGKVTVTRSTGGTLTAGHADVLLNADGKAENARFSGDVTYSEDESARQERGTAADLRVLFDKAGQAEHVSMTGGVRMETREQVPASGAWNSRTLTGQAVEIALGPSGTEKKAEIRDAEATGGARLVVVDEAKKPGQKETRTEMAGDDLKAHFLAGKQVSKVLGTGHTSLHQLNGDGVDEVSSGDTTDLEFRTSDTASHGGRQAEQLASAVQQGHVVTVRKSMRKQGSAMVPVEERSTAEKAVYDADADKVTLTGGVQMTNTESTLWGNRVVVERGAGNATAEGAVRVNYAQAAKDGSEGEPVHILADRAEFKRGPVDAAAGAKKPEADTAFFYGTGRAARLWQGPSQVEAPVLEFEQGAKRLTASGPGTGMVVHTTLVSQGSTVKPAAQKSVAGKASGQGGPVRIASRKMVYTDAAREVVFSGGVLVEDAQGSMKAQQATAYLQGPEAAKAGGPPSAAGKTPGMFLGGSVDRVVATGKIDIVQPGRRGTGEQLVYTSSDGLFVLTGTPAAPPKVEDDARGTVTGAALQFHSGDDSVVVSSGGIQTGSKENAGKRVRTETRVKQ